MKIDLLKFRQFDRYYPQLPLGPENPKDSSAPNWNQQKGDIFLVGYRVDAEGDKQGVDEEEIKVLFSDIQACCGGANYTIEEVGEVQTKLYKLENDLISFLAEGGSVDDFIADESNWHEWEPGECRCGVIIESKHTYMLKKNGEETESTFNVTDYMWHTGGGGTGKKYGISITNPGDGTHVVKLIENSDQLSDQLIEMEHAYELTYNRAKHDLSLIVDGKLKTTVNIPMDAVEPITYTLENKPEGSRTYVLIDSHDNPCGSFTLPEGGSVNFSSESTTGTTLMNTSYESAQNAKGFQEFLKKIDSYDITLESGASDEISVILDSIKNATTHRDLAIAYDSLVEAYGGCSLTINSKVNINGTIEQIPSVVFIPTKEGESGGDSGETTVIEPNLENVIVTDHSEEGYESNGEFQRVVGRDNAYNLILNIATLKGPKGDDGATGAAGQDGKDGSDANINVVEGNVTTGENPSIDIEETVIEGIKTFKVNAVLPQAGESVIVTPDLHDVIVNTIDGGNPSGRFIKLDEEGQSYDLELNIPVIKGEDGQDGADGARGADGKSAYEIAVEHEYVGTEEEWLRSLKGKDGAPGINGADGAPGANGKSAYEIAVIHGYDKSEAQWLESLKGKDGDDGHDGQNGADGKDGADGKSAYEIAVELGFEGSEKEWIESLHGKDGQDGQNGQDGQDGHDGSDANINVVEGSVTTGENPSINVEETTVGGVKTYTINAVLPQAGATTIITPSLRYVHVETNEEGIAEGSFELVQDTENVFDVNLNIPVIRGADGQDGTNGQDGQNGQDGADGEDGNGIENIEVVEQSEASTTYRINFTKTEPFDFTVYNGANGQDGQNGQDGADGHDGQDGAEGPQGPQGETGAQGPEGVGIKEIVLTAHTDEYNVYTISFTDEEKTPFEFTVYNGHDGANGQDGADGHDGQDGAPGQDGADGKDGNGIESIEAVATEEAYTTYRITFTNEDVEPYEFTVYNGQNGQDGATGPQGPQGPQGETGATGPQGPQGQAGNDGTSFSLYRMETLLITNGQDATHVQDDDYDVNEIEYWQYSNEAFQNVYKWDAATKQYLTSDIEDMLHEIMANSCIVDVCPDTETPLKVATNMLYGVFATFDHNDYNPNIDDHQQTGHGFKFCSVRQLPNTASTGHIYFTVKVYSNIK